MSVPVLMYHHVLPQSGFIASSIKEFKEQMEYIAKSGYHTLSLDEFYRYKKGELKPPKKSVLITFDDGWRNNFVYAYPILKDLGLKACIFLVTGWIEEASKSIADFAPLSHKQAKIAAQNNPASVFLNWREVETMKANGIDFASHTHGHSDAYFGDLSFEDEINMCRDTMKKRLGIDDMHLCWPRGVFDKEKLNTAKQAGYELFYTTKRGVNLADGVLDDIRRVAVKKGAKWLKKSLFIYSNDFLGQIYGLLKQK